MTTDTRPTPLTVGDRVKVIDGQRKGTVGRVVMLTSPAGTGRRQVVIEIHSGEWITADRRYVTAD